MPVPPLVSTHPDPDAARGQQRAATAGTLRRVGHATFVTQSAWDDATEWERHIACARAVLVRSPGLVLSHASAAIAHRLPWIQPVPPRVTVLDSARQTGQRTRYCDKAAASGRTMNTVDVDGFPTTDLVDTVVDVALRYDRARALTVADAVLRRGVDREELVASLDERGAARGAVRAARVLDLASSGSTSAGESVTRLVLRDLGLPDPVQQHTFHDARGFVGQVDFWFPDPGIIVEFDGLVKYRDPSMRAGRTAEDVVIDEKLREDRLRALPDVNGFVRLIWRDVVPGGSAPSTLRAAGLVVRRGVVGTPSW